jgi:hypothetical protein
MPYTAEINRTHPGCVLFLIDESFSMSDPMNSEKSKAQTVADILNRTLQNLIVRCGREEGVRDYFEIGVLGYSQDTVRNAMQGNLASSVLHPISEIEANPLEVEERMKKIPDGVGGLIEVPVKFQTWYEPVTNGGTPMSAALARAAEELAIWSDAHPNSFPPVVLHLTDGEPTDGDPIPMSEALREISTDDGSVILANIHISPGGAGNVAYPDDIGKVGGDVNAMRLFAMSSNLPPMMITEAERHGFDVNDRSRMYVYGAGEEAIIQFFDIGTRPSALR